MKWAIIAIVLSLFFCMVSYVNIREAEVIDAEIAYLSIANKTLSITLTFRIRNPSNSYTRIKKLSFMLYMEGIIVAKGIKRDIVITSEEEIVSIDLRINNSELISRIKEKVRDYINNGLSASFIRYRIIGSLEDPFLFTYIPKYFSYSKNYTYWLPLYIKIN